ncbi:MAG: NINE protein [Burkholderiaceae bacterium]|nr:NINE protein [Burkholderiaceae bacterium]
MHKTAQACPNCGAPQFAPGGGKNKVVAAVLAFFLGGLGVHRFYLGKWWGVFYLLFCWTFIPGFIALIEAVVFLVASDESWNAKYNNGLPPKESNTALVVVGVIAAVFFVAIPVIGILAAVAIPAYQDYTVKAKLMGVDMDAQVATQAVSQYYTRTNQLPADLASLGVELGAGRKYIESVTIDQQHGTLDFAIQGIPSLKGKHLLYVPHLDADKNITWSCGGNEFPIKYLPKRCSAN